MKFCYFHFFAPTAPTLLWRVIPLPFFPLSRSTFENVPLPIVWKTSSLSAFFSPGRHILHLFFLDPSLCLLFFLRPFLLFSCSPNLNLKWPLRETRPLCFFLPYWICLHSPGEWMAFMFCEGWVALNSRFRKSISRYLTSAGQRAFQNICPVNRYRL